MSKNFKSLLGGGNSSYESSHEERRKPCGKPKRKPCKPKKHYDDTCETIVTKTKVFVPWQIKIMKPRCANGCSHHGDSTDETCETECGKVALTIPVITKLKKPYCASCN